MTDEEEEYSLTFEDIRQSPGLYQNQERWYILVTAAERLGRHDPGALSNNYNGIVFIEASSKEDGFNLHIDNNRFTNDPVVCEKIYTATYGKFRKCSEFLGVRVIMNPDGVRCKKEE
jgi:hypothetical protein